MLGNIRVLEWFKVFYLNQQSDDLMIFENTIFSIAR